jgi:hypothetical protein
LEDDVRDEEDHGEDGVPIADGELQVGVHARDASLCCVSRGGESYEKDKHLAS